MGILVGMDEAGYGPNLGPLVIAATVWEVDDGDGSPARPAAVGSETAGTATLPRRRVKTVSAKWPPAGFDLYRRLRGLVARRPSERRIAIADSKRLYHPGLGLRQLERGVHSVLQACGQSSACWSSLVRCCGADPDGHHQRYCWPDGFHCPLPVDAGAEELARLSARFERACSAAGVRPLAVRAQLVFPGELNSLTAFYGTKAAALSHSTVGLLRELIDGLSTGESIFAVCDKHGGRNFYTALLQHHFPEHWITPIAEGHQESRYEWGPPEARARVAFRMGGEAFLPTALASMTAKYFRELAMRAFNEFWLARVRGLQPTAGYPADSHRFRKAIANVQRALGIDDHVLWRER